MRFPVQRKADRWFLFRLLIVIILTCGCPGMVMADAIAINHMGVVADHFKSELGLVATDKAAIVAPNEMISDFEARLLLARLLAVGDSRLDEAVSDYQNLAREEEQNIIVRRELAGVLVRFGRHREARENLEIALKVDPTDEELLLSMAGIETALGHARQAKKMTVGVCGTEMTDKTMLSCAGLLLSLGDFYQAEAIAHRYLEKHPEELNGRLLLTDILVGSQRFIEAEGVVRLLLVDFPLMPDLYYRLAMIRILDKDFATALALIDQAPSSIASTPPLLMAAGQANLGAHRYDKALELFSQVANLHSPFRDAALISLARVYRSVGREKECGPLLNDLLTRIPGHIEARYLAAGRDRVATSEFLDSLWREVPATSESLSKLARLFAEDGLMVNALACYDKALALDQEFFSVRLERAQLLAITKQYDTSLEELAYLYREFPTNPKVLLTRARVLGWARHYQEAIAAYDELILLNPTDPTVRIEKARTAVWAKEMSEASKNYADLWAMPVDTQLKSALVRFAHSSNLPTQVQNRDDEAVPWDAVEVFSQLLTSTPGSEIDPEHQEMERIRAELLPAYRLQKAAFLESQSKELLWQKRFSRAITSYSELISFQPGNQEARFDLAQSQCALGLWNEAGDTYEDLLAIAPLHNLATLALAQQRQQNNPALIVQQSFWQEKGRGDLADIERRQTDMTFQIPIHSRFRMEVIAHYWDEDAGKTTASLSAKGLGLRFSGVENQYLKGSFELHRKQYDEAGFDDLDSGAGEVWLNVFDALSLGVGMARRDELANRFALAQGTQADHQWVGIVAPLSRRLELNGMTESIDYNDDNKGRLSRLSLGYSFTDHPRIIKISLKGEARDTQFQSVFLYHEGEVVDIRYPYWTPENYTAGTVELEWLHDLARNQFCGSEQHNYDIKLGLTTDSENNPAIRVEAKYLYEFAEHWRLELSGLVHSSREWDAVGVFSGIQYRF